MRPPCASDGTTDDVGGSRSPRTKTGGLPGMASPASGADFNLKAEVELNFQKREQLSEQMEALSSFLTADGMPGLSGPLVDEEGFPRADIDVYAVREARHRLAYLQTDYRNVQRRLEELLFRLHAESPMSRANETPCEPAPIDSCQEEQRADEEAPPPLHKAQCMYLRQPAALVLASFWCMFVWGCLDYAAEGPAFALVDVLQPQSPSSAAGLVCGDKILRLGCLRLPSPRDAAAGHTDASASNGVVAGGSCSNMTVSELFRLLPGEVERYKNERMPVVIERQNRVLSLWLTPRQWAGRGLLGCHLKPILQD
ncbi:hypothetical protein Emag_000970 [Eimeria magna]